MTDGPVAIAGGGPAGLVVARHLAASGLDVDVYEAAETVGGRVRSRALDGFTLDRGFQVLFTGYPAVQRELDLDALDLRTVPPGAVVCRRRRRSILADPLRDPLALPQTLFSTAVTTGDKLRLWRLRRELRQRSRNEIFSGPDRSIHEELLDRGFSDAFVEGVARPFFGGITLDSSLSTSKRVFEYVLKVLSAGDTAVPAAGVGAVTDQLAERAEAAGATVHVGQRVDAVSSTRSTATLSVGDDAVRADAAVVATDAPTARELTGVEAIPTEARSCTTQYYSLPAETVPNTRRLHLNAETRSTGGPNHVFFPSNVVPEAAPDGRALVSATFLDDADASAAKLDDRTRRSLAAWYPERQFGDLELLATDRTDFGQFAQPPGVHDALPDVGAPRGRCYLAGEFTRCSSLNAAMESGRTAAQRVLADL